MAEKKTAAELKAEKVKELKAFRLDVAGVKHAQKEVIRFTWRNKNIDLRTASETVVKAIAADPYNKVLVLTETEKATAKAEPQKEAAGKAAGAK